MPRRQPHADPCRVRQGRQGIRNEAIGHRHLRAGFRSEEIGARKAVVTLREAAVGGHAGTGLAARLAALHPLQAWGGALLVLIALPLLVLNGYQQYLLDLIMINVVLAVGLNIVKGFAGQVNVGHVALAAIGAYTSAVLSTKFGVPFWFALPLATLATGGVGAIVGVPSFRLEGAYVALATLGLAESVRMFIGVTYYLGASIGFGDIPPPFIGEHRLDSYYAYYYIVMPVAFVGTYLAYSILRSDVGRALMAIREDSLAAAAAGINVRKYKLLAFVISALYAGCAGSLA